MYVHFVYASTPTLDFVKFISLVQISISSRLNLIIWGLDDDFAYAKYWEDWLINDDVSKSNSFYFKKALLSTFETLHQWP